MRRDVNSDHTKIINLRTVSTSTRNAGFTLVESIVGVSILIIVAVGIYQSFSTLMQGVRMARAKTVALSVLNEEMELLRNLQYQDVGIQGGIPLGKLPATTAISRGGVDFLVTRFVKDVDDPFDGTISGVGPNHDNAPADYRRVEIHVDCTSCPTPLHVQETTYAAPKSLEGSATGGVLGIRVCDANGNKVPNATVHIQNNVLIPARIINDVTDNGIDTCAGSIGNYLLLDTPASPGYHASTTKAGYTFDETLAPTAQNPNPNNPDQSVSAGSISQITLFIDRVSSFAISTTNDVCAAIPNVPFHVEGAELIGTSPNVLRYSLDTQTDASGLKSLSNLKWDLYKFAITGPGYDLAGSIPVVPFNLVPNANQNLQFILTPKVPKALLITVKDGASGASITDASVTLEKGGASTTIITGRGTLSQTDWSGGPGQALFTDETKYFNSDGNVSISSPSGELKLEKLGPNYQPSAWLESSTFDTGGANNFYNISWGPTNQPVETGTDPIKFQIASNNNNVTWNYVGPDNTSGTYYTIANTNISNHNGRRYLRYKVFLSTADVTKTPNVSDIAFTFTSSCVPPGQAFFNGLVSGNYTLTVTRTGYQNVVQNHLQVNDYETLDVLMNP